MARERNFVWVCRYLTPKKGAQYPVKQGDLGTAAASRVRRAAAIENTCPFGLRLDGWDAQGFPSGPLERTGVRDGTPPKRRNLGSRKNPKVSVRSTTTVFRISALVRGTALPHCRRNRA